MLTYWSMTVLRGSPLDRRTRERAYGEDNRKRPFRKKNTLLNEQFNLAAQTLNFSENRRNNQALGWDEEKEMERDVWRGKTNSFIYPF